MPNKHVETKPAEDVEAKPTLPNPSGTEGNSSTSPPVVSSSQAARQQTLLLS